MERDRSKRRTGMPGGTVTGALTLLLVICLAECATGSCLSYGHSCWGAHGKRSGKLPSAAPDWFLAKLFRSMDANKNDMLRERLASKNDDVSGIYRGDGAIDSSLTDRLGSDGEDFSLEAVADRNPDAKPMLDEDILSKIKLWQNWQIMKNAPLE